MIPYFRYTQIPIGPLHIQVWGLLVATGILLATWLASREADKAGLRGEVLFDLAVWLIVPAFIGARLVHVLAYEPAYYAAHPLEVFMVWKGGASSVGGFLGAAVGGWLFFLRRRDLRADLRGYLESAAFAFPLGMAIGRIGCFLIHDHPGMLSNAFFAVRYPGGARLDHGLLLSVTNAVIFLVFLAIKRGRPIDKKAGMLFLPLYMGLYGIARFILDFYRAWDLPGSDTRYFGLTPAQYGCVVLVAVACYLGYHAFKDRRKPSADGTMRP